MRTLETKQNRRSFLASTAVVGVSAALGRAAHTSANDEISLAIIGLGGRGNFLLKKFAEIPGVNIRAICDPDRSRLEATRKEIAKKYSSKRQPEAFTDLRFIMDRSDIDAVVVATCNQWHCLATIWACQAGKDVYVEKPLGQNIWEQQQAVAAARKYKRIVQVGTQQRSNPMQAEIKQFLHGDASLGKPTHVVATRFGERAPIGKRTSPLQPSSQIDYDLWLGPAADEPIYRNQLQYDWHWNWNTGNGEMGNWGVHILDDVRNVVLQDQVEMPNAACSVGGRVGWQDAGETPNVHSTLFESSDLPVFFALSNLDPSPDTKTAINHNGPSSGYVAYCEGGRLCGERGKATAYDLDGKVVKEFAGDLGNGHYANFITAVRERRADLLNADVEVGHHSSSWCHIANATCASGVSAVDQGSFISNSDEVDATTKNLWTGLNCMLVNYLQDHQINPFGGEIVASPSIRFDGESQCFVGEGAKAANQWLRRDYRSNFEVSEQIV